jgi:hypothetical protein
MWLHFLFFQIYFHLILKQIMSSILDGFISWHMAQKIFSKYNINCVHF